MRIYVVSLVVGLLVGVLYGTLGVRSPAPPVVALIGLFGMLIGERIPPLIKQTVHSARTELSSPLRQIEAYPRPGQGSEDRADPQRPADTRDER